MNSVLRHCGVLQNTGSRVYILWRELDDKPDTCLIVGRDSLPEVFGEPVQALVLSTAQSYIDLWDAMDKYGIIDGKNMLSVLHKSGYIRPEKTKNVLVTIGGESAIPLDVLNEELRKNNRVKAGVKESVIKAEDIPLPSAADDMDNTIANQLIQKAQEHERKATELYNRAKAIGVEKPAQEEDGFITIKIPVGTKQTKAIEMVKEYYKVKSNE